MRIKLLLIFSTALLLSSCELDDNLFNPMLVDEYKLPGNTIPASFIEQAIFDSEGYKLYGYWIRSKERNNPVTILYCHGNKHHIDEYWDRVMLLHETGANIFIFDYRGFGKSEGKSSETGLYADGRAALSYIKNVKGVMDDELCIYGYSLGNVVSIYLASKITDPLCLIAEAPFAAANSLLQGSTLLDIPEGWLTGGRFNNIDMVKGVHTRFLLMHGTNDDFIRYEDNGRLVYNAAPQPKELILVEGAHHTNIPGLMGLEEYLRLMRKYLYFEEED
jgi:fermentation-respiration switch protein FrsA (DUF1100 family)